MAKKKKVAEKKVVAKKAAPKKKAVKKAAPKKKVAPKKAAVKKPAGKKAAGGSKKVAVKKVVAKKVAGKKAAGGTKKVVAKKAAVKKVAGKKVAVSSKKVASKKVVAKKKTTESRSHGVKKVATEKVEVKKAVVKSLVSKPVVVKSVIEKKVVAANVSPIAKPETKNEKHFSKPLSIGQLKKASAKKKMSEVETLIKDTYTKNTPVPKNVKPVDHAAYILAKTIVEGILEKKGENIVCLDLRNIENRVCDYFIICEGNSTTQIDAIGQSVEFTVKKTTGERPYRSEGWNNALWILIDYVNVIVHVFERETRQFYNLESLWADAEEMTF